MTEDLFQYALHRWIETKKKYCMSWNEYCGVGEITSNNFEEEKEKINLLVRWEDETPIYEKVQAFTVFDIDEMIDMEHG